MPVCARCGKVQATGELRRVRADSKKENGHVCKDTYACERRRAPNPLERRTR